MTTPAKPADSKEARTERLAAALRENLKRRKAQARLQVPAAGRAVEQTKDKGESN